MAKKSSAMSKGDRFATAAISWAVAWSGISAAIGIPIMLVESIVLYAVYGCWLLGQYGNCTEQIIAKGGAWWMIFLPMILGGGFGLAVVVRYRGRLRNLAG